MIQQPEYKKVWLMVDKATCSFAAISYGNGDQTLLAKIKRTDFLETVDMPERFISYRLEANRTFSTNLIGR